MKYCELVYVDREVGEDGHIESLLVMDYYYQSWVGCYCKIGE
jgi:hypothetical protein